MDQMMMLWIALLLIFAFLAYIAWRLNAHISSESTKDHGPTHSLAPPTA